MEILGLAKKGNVLKPFGHTDTLLYYTVAASKLQNFLRGREIATKTWLPHENIPVFLKRGTKSEPLYIQELNGITEEIIRQRATANLKDARGKLTKEHAKVWDYFVPRKLIEFFYATNNERPGGPIERIFIDVDRGKGISSKQAQEVTALLVQEIRNDKKLAKLLKFRIFIMWTGSSFHLYLLLKKKIDNAYYEKHFAYKKDFPLESFTGRWADAINKKTKINIWGGHEKVPGCINIDPSQTPSGKLARAPFSLHLKSATEIDGVALPVDEKQLQDKRLAKKLKAYTPEKVISEIDKLGKLLI